MITSGMYFFPRSEESSNEPSALCMLSIATSLGHQVWRRVFWEGDKFFKLCPTHFSGGCEKFCSGASPPLLTGLATSVWLLHQCGVIHKPAWSSPKQVPQFFKQQHAYVNSKNSVQSLIVNDYARKNPLLLFTFQTAHALMQRQKHFAKLSL